MLAVVLCAQNVVDAASAPEATKPAHGEPAIRRALRPTTNAVNAPVTAPIRLTRHAGSPIGIVAKSQASIVNSAYPGGCATPSSGPTI